MRVWGIFALAVVAGLWVASCSGVAGSAAGQPTPVPGDAFAGMLKAGQRAPNVTLLDLQGSQVRISDFKGKPLVINFWATWCPPCRAEIPELDAVYREYRDKGLEVLGIDYGEDAETVRAFMKGMDVSYRVVVDPGSEAADRYRVAALPTSFFVDAEGVIQAVHLGGMDRKALQEKLDKILVK